jgi:ketosteroid isomerase-like protein
VTVSDAAATVVADQLAVTAVVLRYFALVDAKAWDQLDEVLTEDTTAQWTATTVMRGRQQVAQALATMTSSDEIVTFHHVSAMVPEIDGDRATVAPRVRAMHHGRGRRAGLFYESMAVQPTELVRTADGWRIAHHRWEIAVTSGSVEELFAPERAGGVPY